VVLDRILHSIIKNNTQALQLKQESDKTKTQEYIMKIRLSISLAIALAVLVPTTSNGQLYVNATIGGVPSVSGAPLETFDEPSPPILTVSGSAGIVPGTPGYFAGPYFSGSTAAYFGEMPSLGTDGTPFVGVGSYATATLSFSAPKNYFGLLWGSVDADNSLTFYDAANNVIGTVYGSTFPPATYYGDQGVDGTFYVNVTSTIPFSKVVASNSGDQFEFDDVAYALVVPEPSSIALLGCGLCLLGLGWRHHLVKYSDVN